MEQLCSPAGAPTGLIVQVCFPGARSAVLDNLNRQREEGRLCDLAIQVQGHVFRAHRCVLAASSPYFHDQVLLKNVTMVSLPSVMDPLAFQSVLTSAYTGQLSIVHEDIVNYVTVASFLQMWHIVDKCTEILKRQRPLAETLPGDAAATAAAPASTTTSTSLASASSQPGTSSRQQSPSSSDCLYVEREGRRRDRKPDALPPLATWRRPQQFPRWGRARGPPPAGPHSAADSQLGASLPGYGDCGDYAGCEEVWLTSAGAKDALPNADGHYAPQLGAGGGGGGGGGVAVGCGLEGLRQRVRLHQRGADRADRSREGGEASELPPPPPAQQERRKGERGGMEADEGVGEEGPGRRDRCLQPGHAGDSHGQASDGEASGRLEVRGRPEDEKEHADASLMARACGSDQGMPPSPPRLGPSPRMQWQASPWSQAEARPQEPEEGEEEEEDASEVDFEHLAEGHFEGKTYDEIQDGTGQVSQRPLVPVSPDHHAEFGLAWPSAGQADAASAPATPSRALSPAASQFPLGPASPPIPSSSSSLSLAGAPYTGKVHFCHCGKAYTLKSMRDRHVKMQHLNLRPFGCPVCAKTFKMKHHLTKHLKTHGGLRPYECGLCGKKVIWRESFLRHQARCERLAAANNANNGAASSSNGAASSSSSGGVVGGPAMGPEDAGAYGGFGFDHGEAFLALAGQVKVEEADFGGDATGDDGGGGGDDGGGGGRLMASVAGIMDELRSQSRLLHGHVFKEEASEGFS